VSLIGKYALAREKQRFLFVNLQLYRQNLENWRNILAILFVSLLQPFMLMASQPMVTLILGWRQV
jgi:hypothetical protein